jgi:hypothetical protein
MLIKLDVLEAIRRGDIDLQFRRWKRRSVKPGGTLKTRVGILAIGEITPIRAEDVTEADAKRAGFADVADFLVWLDTMKPGELDRIEISYHGEDPLIAFRNNADLSDQELTEVVATLDKMDAQGKVPQWTLTVMNLIAGDPGRLAEE